MNACKIVYLSNKYKVSKMWLAHFFENINRFIYGCDIAIDVSLGNNLSLPHQGLGVVIGPKVKTGDNVVIYQNVTLGANGERYTALIIGNNVMIGAGSCVLGNVRIGNNVRIGANSVVLSDIPDNCIVAGVPAQIKRLEAKK